jgi:hypothetical protein
MLSGRKYSPPRYKKIIDMHKLEEAKTEAWVKQELNDALAISLIVDGWSSSIMTSFLGISCLYASPDGTMKVITGKFTAMTGKMSSSKVSSLIVSFVREYDIASRIVRSVADSCSQMIKSCRNLLVEKPDEIVLTVSTDEAQRLIDEALAVNELSPLEEEAILQACQSIMRDLQQEGDEDNGSNFVTFIRRIVKYGTQGT